jgi:NADPH-dependent 2,4-dienoyl-CoA reductase/sulfur reductase-like enzyme
MTSGVSCQVDARPQRRKSHASQTVLILGGGIGGIVAASDLRRKLPAEHRVVVVERNAEHAFAPSFLWLMTGGRRTSGGLSRSCCRQASN